MAVEGAVQAVELRAPLHPGRATGALAGSLRRRVAHLDSDRLLGPDLEAAVDWLASGEWRVAVESSGGVLA